MAKKIAAVCSMFLLASFMYIFAAPHAFAAALTTTVYVDPPSIVNSALVPTTIFNVSIKIDNIDPTPGLAGIELNLTWDPTILNGVLMQEIIFHEVTPESEWGNIWKLKSVVNNYSVAYTYTWQDLNAAVTGGYAPISGSHTIANVTLKVVGVGKTALHFYVSKLGDPSANAITHDTFDGFFDNVPPPPPPSSSSLSVDPPKIVDTNLTTGKNFTVNVNVTNAVNLAALGFLLGFNVSALNVIAINAGSFIGGATPVTFIDNVSGFVAFNVSLSSATNGSGIVATIEFLVMADGVNKSPLHLYDVTLINSDGQIVPSPTTDGSFTNMKIIPGDINEDGTVDIFDALLAANSFNATPSDPNWNPAADVNGDVVVDIFDIIIIGSNFGRTA